ncbi:DUF883 domain-containing protein [Pseudomonas sp. UL073]|uniref:DUF883 domain-containing protein n=1 Tax=Zestomonas insulae TaxID=2809017 RepID=A0ABS2IIP9_9GAMM|nr:DUF883 family protein [Pseudomonas insulae]MBM7062640.1 DUF883 domain-containing protein [Pseudomonas insulae]
MALLSRHHALHDLEAEIQSVLSTLETLKEGASEESRRSLASIRKSAERALTQSRSLLGDTYDEVKDRTYRAGVATYSYGREHPLASAGLMLGVLGLLGYLYYSSQRD